jgi:hypothetical protein
VNFRVQIGAAILHNGHLVIQVARVERRGEDHAAGRDSCQDEFSDALGLCVSERRGKEGVEEGGRGGRREEDTE